MMTKRGSSSALFVVRRPLRGGQLSCETSSPKHGKSGSLSPSFRRECGGRRLGDRSVIAKNHISKTPIRFRSNRKAQRKVALMQGPSHGSGHHAGPCLLTAECRDNADRRRARL